MSSERVLAIIADSHQQACEELENMNVVKHLPEKQQRVVTDLTEELIKAERSCNDPLVPAEARVYFLSCSISSLKRAVEAEVPREVLLAVLDRDFPRTDGG